MKKYFNARVLAQGAFILLALVFVIIYTLGFTFDWTKLREPGFWVEVAVRLGATMAIYNAMFSIDSSTRRLATSGRYYEVLATNRIRVDRIYRENLFGALDEAVKAENEERKKRAVNRILRRVSSRLSYEDVIDQPPEKLDEICKAYLLTDKQKAKLKKTLRKIYSGGVKYEAITADDLLIDKEHDKDRRESLKVDLGTFVLKQNIIKAVMFVLTTIAMSAISRAETNLDLVYVIISNAVLVGGACASAIAMSYNYLKLRTSVFERRNIFLSKRLGLTDELRPVRVQE